MLKHISLLLIAIIAVAGAESCKAKKKQGAAAATISPEASHIFESAFIDACTHANNGNVEMAIKYFRKCADIKPQEASVQYELSRLYERSGDAILALQYAMNAYQLSPQNKFYAIWYAGRLSRGKQYEAAIKVLEKAREENKKDAQIVNDLDHLYDLMNNTDKRIALWNNFQAEGYKLSSALKLVELYKAKKDYKSAHMVYDEIKKASPRKYQYFIDDANLYLSQGDEANANTNFEKALEINPNNWNINTSLFQAYRNKKDKVRAGMFLRQAMTDINVGMTDKLAYSAKLYRETKSDTTSCYYAGITAAELEALYPDNAESRFTAAELWRACGLYVKALPGYRKASELNPNLYDAWVGAIESSGRLGQYEDMLASCTAALEYFPNIAFLYAKAATASNHLRKYEQALAHVQNGMRYALDDNARSQLLIQQGLANFGLKKYDASLKSFEDAMAIPGAGTELYDYLGNAQFFLGKTDEAVKNWEKAKQMGLSSQTLERKIKDRKYYE